MVLILGPVDCWILLGLFHGWFDVEVEVNPGTYTHARYMTGSM